MPTTSRHPQFYIVDSNLESALEESRMSYKMLHESGEHPDIDYAGYCGHLALSNFKKLLNDPNLTPARLSGMMRQAAHHHQQQDPALRWSLFMADYITRHSNMNAH